jgi:hypothetical protein
VYQELPASIKNKAYSPNAYRTLIVDKQTRLPIEMRDSSGVRRYLFEGKQANMKIPSEVTNAISQHLAAKEKRLKKYRIAQ